MKEVENYKLKNIRTFESRYKDGKNYKFGDIQLENKTLANIKDLFQ